MKPAHFIYSHRFLLTVFEAAFMTEFEIPFSLFTVFIFFVMLVLNVDNHPVEPLFSTQEIACSVLVLAMTIDSYLSAVQNCRNAHAYTPKNNELHKAKI